MHVFFLAKRFFLSLSPLFLIFSLCFFFLSLHSWSHLIKFLVLLGSVDVLVVVVFVVVVVDVVVLHALAFIIINI